MVSSTNQSWGLINLSIGLYLNFEVEQNFSLILFFFPSHADSGMHDSMYLQHR